MTTNRNIVIAALAAGLALSGCAATTTSGDAPSTAAAGTAAAAPAPAPAPAPVVAERDLTPQEKKIIVAAIAPSLLNAGAAKYRWTKFPVVPETDTPAYCATVDAQSPHAAYNGHQTYIVDTKTSGGHITAAVLGLIAGGKDAAIVAGMCEQHGLDPNKAS